MADYNACFETNLTAVFYTCVSFLELLDAGNQQGGLEQGWTSQVIGVSSNAAFVNDPSSGFGYSAAKAGLNQLFKQLAHYLAPYEIRSNVLAPGCESIFNILVTLSCVDLYVKGILLTRCNSYQSIDRS